VTRRHMGRSKAARPAIRSGTVSGGMRIVSWGGSDDWFSQCECITAIGVLVGAIIGQAVLEALFRLSREVERSKRARHRKKRVMAGLCVDTRTRTCPAPTIYQQLPARL
jgi:hypothetical protein